MVQPEGFVDPKHPNKVCKLQRSIYGLKQASRREATYIIGIKIIHDRSKRIIALSQSVYLDKILKKFRVENSKKGYTLMMENPDYRKSQGAKTRSEPNPGKIHWTAVKTILNFQTDKDDTKSKTGYVFILNGGAIDRKSAKQSTTAMSSTEAEYITAAKALIEAVWMRKFVDGLGDVVPSNKRPM
uniref:Retrotransposon protein, putative, Ty1-copia subclass n=1 Tax=Tanacetum cinerariifolium TaxID=118510 RepID=A0A6L2LCA7_TANCI|nr:hypothetical protein [Tanacetum cinerariifolium]